MPFGPSRYAMHGIGVSGWSGGVFARHGERCRNVSIGCSNGPGGMGEPHPAATQRRPLQVNTNTGIDGQDGGLLYAALLYFT